MHRSLKFRPDKKSRLESVDQLLVRAAIRMLLVMFFIDHLENWMNCSEKKAAEMIIDHLPTSYPEEFYA